MSLFKSVFSFGSPCNGQYGHLVLQSSGNVYGYKNPNEASWSLNGGELLFHHEDGRITSRFHEVGNGVWIGKAEASSWPLYLIPVITLEQANTAQDLPPVFINSIPKSGTYFFEAALIGLGYQSTRLHLSGHDVVDDFRNLRDEEIHVAPELSRLIFPNQLATALLGRGQMMVGHIQHAHIIEEIQNQGVLVIHLIRDLRDILISLYRFKLSKVAAVDDMDRYWRELTEKARLAAFIQYHHHRDFEHIQSIARMIASQFPNNMQRYEDSYNGQLGKGVEDLLNSASSGLADRLMTALLAQRGVQTPTFSGQRSSREDIWSNELQQYFNLSGLSDCNLHLGYDT